MDSGHVQTEGWKSPLQKLGDERVNQKKKGQHFPHIHWTMLIVMDLLNMVSMKMVYTMKWLCKVITIFMHMYLALDKVGSQIYISLFLSKKIHCRCSSEAHHL